MSVRTVILEAIEHGDLAMLERAVAADPRAVRHLLSLTYQPSTVVRHMAAQGLAMAATHHPDQVKEVIHRLIWAMNDESGTNATGAPEVLHALAEACPELLVPAIPDLLRLSGDPTLHDELVTTVRRVAEKLPSEAAAAVRRGLRHCQEEGGPQHGCTV